MSAGYIWVDTSGEGLACLAWQEGDNEAETGYTVNRIDEVLLTPTGLSEVAEAHRCRACGALLTRFIRRNNEFKDWMQRDGEV